MNSATPQPSRFDRFRKQFMLAFHGYAAWLVSITWKRFALLALLLMILAGVLQSIPPFRWRTTETVTERPVRKSEAQRAGKQAKDEVVNITIDGDGVRVRKEPKRSTGASPSSPSSPTPPATPGASAADTGLVTPTTPGTPASPVTSADDRSVHITLPPSATADAVREAVSEALDQARVASEEDDEEQTWVGPRTRHVTTNFGEALPEMAFFWILLSAIIKFTYKGQMRAEARAAVATEAAEAETLKRQVVEARMAAMQAQVEPHFLFNTLASIDHLIETDPPRASKMQKNLIALLRASMPTMRESNGTGLQSLGSEMSVIQPYLEILKVRMEDRLETRIDVPEGLRSAAFPPMMLQSLVENAIKHGLEPKAEGGTLHVKAEIVHGRLMVSVSDTGLGFGQQPQTAGTGVGLQNIRERLNLLYGDEGKLIITAHAPAGTMASITVPYKALANA